MQVVQEAMRLWWETSKASEKDMAILEEKFSQVVVVDDEDI